MHQEPRIPFTITGNYSKGFLESMGYKKIVFPLCEISKNPQMPLEPVKLAYSEVAYNIKVENPDGPTN
jgi:hypothetical protein